MKLQAWVGAILLWSCPVVAAGAKRPALDYWVAPTTELIRPGTLSWGAGRKAWLTAARGEREAFFVMLPGSDPGRASVEVRSSAFSGDDGVIAAGQVRAWRAAWVEAEGRRYPDALLPLDHPTHDVAGIASVKRGDDLVLYVELSVPRGATPGFYSGSVQVLTSRGEATIPVRLEVVPVALPEEKRLAVTELDHVESMPVGMPGYSIRSRGWSAWGRNAGLAQDVREIDSSLFYGSRQFESVRLKLLEDGLEDYELLRVADRAGKGVLARVMALRMTRHPEVIDFHAVRTELFRALTE